LNPKEQDTIDKVCTIFRNQGLIPCTGCRYCTEVCPQNIPIPQLFTALNEKRQDHPWTISGKEAADCIRCGKCEKLCPQDLKIRDLLVVASEEL
jgi:predicted aldo/keto reductase-like oxidoreductase